MPLKGTPAGLVPAKDGFDALARKIKAQDDRLRALESLVPLQCVSRNFDGTTQPPAAGTQGWALTADGAGIFNELVLPDGIIDDEALANPCAFAVIDERGSANYAVGPVGSYLTQTITVPAGFTTGYLLATGVANLGAPGVSAGLYCSIELTAGAITSDLSVITVGASASGSVSATLAASATGLSGTFQVILQAATSVTVASSSGYGSLSGLVIFLR